MADYELDDAALMRRMQMRRLGIVEDILDAKDEQSGAPVKANLQDPKMLKIALTAMGDIDKSIINRQRLDLEQKAQENDEAQGAVIIGAVKQVLAAGGFALRGEGADTSIAAAPAPTPDASQLPVPEFKTGETRQGSEHIEYDDIMNPGGEKK
ncbi:hypothetical protein BOSOLAPHORUS_158 [Erwinia phage vB_EamM_Bosolaphorus]|uniref:Uncharacterized protein n=1 Tax=Erwinia phage vB_EamM_Bosolaphorus TaxID=2060126 RepID=A0A2H5BI31_9CAUD|nr:hypothetical protein BOSOLAPHORUS_158 [Erwinia phage vB_EamM_Bosolaphorus]